MYLLRHPLVALSQRELIRTSGNEFKTATEYLTNKLVARIAGEAFIFHNARVNLRAPSLALDICGNVSGLRVVFWSTSLVAWLFGA